jgi:putative NADH-flavin reductase
MPVRAAGVLPVHVRLEFLVAAGGDLGDVRCADRSYGGWWKPVLAALLADVFAGVDVVIVVVHGAVDGRPFLVNLVPGLLALADKHGTRLGFVGGGGSLQVAPGGPRIIDSPDFPPQFRAEATAQAQVLDVLQAADTAADWFYLSPPAGFGSYAPGERTGRYRVGDDVLLTDADGKSEISGADYAIAVLDEIEKPAHHRKRFTVAY